MTSRSSLTKRTSGLAGALAIAGGTAAYSDPVFVNPPPDLTNVATGNDTTVSWDVNGDGITDFTFVDRYPDTPAGSYGVVWQLDMNPASGTAATNGLVSYQGAFVRYASALNSGTNVGAANTTFSTGAQVVLGSKYSYGGNGENYYGGFASHVPPGTKAYVGFRFSAPDGTHYGWVQLSINAGVINFTDAAYETNPNTGIPTGIASAIPEPGTLAMLALGAVGVVGSVRKRRAA